ncbi:G-protein coupled receptor GRL101-like [Oscarella lobularis]|uniref:G-protein coupled receptor GRL101-like n=1 Tax=Oscarella lobularis TaxID=121494 RepID=UPI0033135355
MLAYCGNESFKVFQSNSSWITWDEYGALRQTPVLVIFWIDATIALLGNAIVFAWRCCQPRDARYSPVSFLVMNMAVSNFLYGVHLLFYQVSISQCTTWDAKIETELCRISAICFGLSAIMNNLLTIAIALTTLIGLFARSCYVRLTIAKMALFIAIEWLVAAAVGILLGVLYRGHENIKGVGETMNWHQCSPLHFGYTLDLFPKSFALNVVDRSVYYLETFGVFLTVLLYVILIVKICTFKFKGKGTKAISCATSGLGVRLVVIITINVVDWLSFSIFYLKYKNDANAAEIATKPSSQTVYHKIAIMSIFLHPLLPVVNPFLYAPVQKIFSLKALQCCRKKTPPESSYLLSKAAVTYLFPDTEVTST